MPIVWVSLSSPDLRTADRAVSVRFTRRGRYWFTGIRYAAINGVFRKLESYACRKWWRVVDVAY